MKCYASILGNCSSKQSKEHYISQSLWMSDSIIYRGFSWLNGEEKRLPVKNVARKILCTSHNEQLSDLDSEAKRFFNVGAILHNNQHKRGQLKRSAMWKVDREFFDGHILERIFTKIAVGIMQETPEQKWHLTGSLAIEPPLQIIETLYGLRRFESPLGLYSMFAIGDFLQNQDEVSISTLFHPETDGYIGSIISMRNWQFLINLSDVNLEEYNMQSLTGQTFGKDYLPLIYRMEDLNFNSNGKLSGQLNINWD